MTWTKFPSAAPIPIEIKEKMIRWWGPIILITHPKVLDVAVIGVPDEIYGESVKGVVQPLDPSDAGPDLALELITYCRSKISKIKCPATIDFVNTLPRTPTGKLIKRLIKPKSPI